MQSTANKESNSKEQHSSKNEWNVVVNSIGNAGMSAVPALYEILLLSKRDIARHLFQAPSTLAENLSQPSADYLKKFFTGLGLDVAVIPGNSKFQEGTGDYVLFLRSFDFSRINDVLHLIIQLTGRSSQQVSMMLNNVPMPIVSNVSEKNAYVLKARFAKLNAELVAELMTEDNTSNNVINKRRKKIAGKLAAKLKKSSDAPFFNFEELEDLKLIQGINQNTISEKDWGLFYEQKLEQVNNAINAKKMINEHQLAQIMSGDRLRKKSLMKKIMQENTNDKKK